MKSLRLFLLIFPVALSCFGAVDLGDVTASTPYEAYMGPVKKVLHSLGSAHATMPRVEALMKEGYGFKYEFKEPYLPRSPVVTAATRTGDCKDKSLWLCAMLGDSRVRFVIGRASSSSKRSHAWVLWQSAGRWWILDCTQNSHPVAADSVGVTKYIPRYSYDKSACYRHQAATGEVAGKLKPASKAASL